MATRMQKTLAKCTSTLEGTSLHTGQTVKLIIKPAEPNTGFKFRRVDLPDKPFIDASAAKVQTVERATTLAEGSVKVHTVEHILSALTGMGVDNAIIEMVMNRQQDFPCVVLEEQDGGILSIQPGGFDKFPQSIWVLDRCSSTENPFIGNAKNYKKWWNTPRKKYDLSVPSRRCTYTDD